MLKKRDIVALCMVVVIAGCTFNSATPAASIISTKSASTLSGNAVQEALSPPVETPVMDTVEVLPQSPLQLIIDNPKDGDTLSSQDVTVTGRTAPGGVVSIDDVFTIADQAGHFSLALHLETGLQLITVEASNSGGEDIILTLSVDVQPE
jgi:hypothetical protein